MLKELIKYSWPMIPNSLSNWVMNFSDRVIISSKLGIEEMSIYSVANKIPNLFTSAQGTFVLAWQENASIASKDDDKNDYYTKMFDSVSRIYFFIMSFLIACSPILFKLLIKGNYDEAYTQMPILFLALLFSGISSFIGGIYVAMQKTKNIGITTIIAAVINIIVNIFLIDKIGIYAGSISTLVSYICLSGYRMRDIKRFIDIKYNLKNFIIYVFILVSMSVLNYQRKILFDIINMVIAIIASLMINRDMLKKILKNHKKEKLKL